ncbi:electron transfer flavoprotein subunit alpha/FixB family protein [Georgenia yuyongxinii]|uniref:Electron transfer flavoprotein subunit alpha/FixB family protein n=1 Tax=Georgenia yuyongxinii TaxID=2589797 RepID=A0A5B8C1J8_9MICO|nr:electron transfer flavoprotein subunit alpha/FixB family protein [Georgenia yuyongxinii]QDC24559.1 electron transfer flavoprotein subunit alpha/FixB family protein [Georgenia yuyongxinii]
MSSAYILVADDARIGDLVAAAAATTTTALVVGSREVAERVATSGVDTVVRLVGAVDDAPLEAYAAAVAEIVAEASPDLVLVATRPAERVLAGAVVARTGAPVFTMVSSVHVSDGSVELTRDAFGGIAQETLRVAGTAVVVVDGGPAVEAGTPVEVTERTVEPAPGTTVVEDHAAERAAVDLSRAPRIVTAGRGVKAREDLALVDALASALDAESACSRPLAEGVGWYSRDRYIGVTGQHVQPELYVAVGVSGQLQHAVGARGSGTIVAINADKDCPYFAEADYCVVGDLYSVVPAVTEALS